VVPLTEQRKRKNRIPNLLAILTHGVNVKTMPTTTNKQRVLTHLFTGLKKRYDPPDPEQRPVLEQLLYAVLREGTTVLLTGNDQTVAARPWREIETEDHRLKGWVSADFLQLLGSTP